MKKEHLEKNISEATLKLLELVRNSCSNEISNNCLYIISEIKEDDSSFKKRRKLRNRVNNNKVPQKLPIVISELKRIYTNLYDINLFVFKSMKNKTIVEIQYYPKSSLDTEFLTTVLLKDPMLHCKLSIPPFRKEKDKFDVNWELNGLKLSLNMFWYKVTQ